MMHFFVVFMVTVTFLFLAYIRWHLVRGTGRSVRTRWAITGVLGLVFLIQLIGPMTYRFKVLRPPVEVIEAIQWICYLIMGLLILTVALFVVRDLGLIGQKLAQRFKRKTAPLIESPDRREFINRMTSTGILGLATGMTGLGLKSALDGPRIVEVEVPISGLPREFDGFKIAHITDLHIGPMIKKFEVDRVVRMTNELNADSVVITGDLIDGHVHELREAAAPLGDIQSKYGKFYVNGNHEYYWDVDGWGRHMTELGYIHLQNNNHLVSIGEAQLAMAGVNDYACKRIRPDHSSDPKIAVAGLPSNIKKILLAHQPNSWKAAVGNGYDLQISGHTHSGQFFPGNLAVSLIYRFYSGLGRHESGMWVYVGAGTGYWGPPNRFGIPSEIGLIRLKSV